MQIVQTMHIMQWYNASSADNADNLGNKDNAYNEDKPAILSRGINKREIFLHYIV
jgi:hypothetical protein